MYYNLKSNIKKILGKSRPQIKEPRKKVQIRLEKYELNLDRQINELKTNLLREDIHELLKLAGEKLMNSAMEFINNNYMSNSSSRMINIPISLLDEDDYSIWVNNQAKLLGDLIFCFNSTTK